MNGWPWLLAVTLAISAIFAGYNLARAETVELSRSLVPIGNLVIYTVVVTDDTPDGCKGLATYTFQEGGICIFPGFHIARVNGAEGEPDVVLLGADIYARVRGGPMSVRLGAGLSFIDEKVPGKMETPWVARGSIQGQWNFKSWFPFFTFSHWSNGRGGAEKLGIEKAWPRTNDGGNTFSLGLGAFF